MFAMLAAIAKHKGGVDFIEPAYWPLLRIWGDYLVETALDPGNQLCTDDFEGPSPHNANLVGIFVDTYTYIYVYKSEVGECVSVDEL